MQRLVSISLALLLLFSSTGITYAQHFCGDHMMMDGITLGKQDMRCGMVVVTSDCDSEPQEPMGCCDNQYTSIDTDDSFVKASFSIDFDVLDVAIVPMAIQFVSQDNTVSAVTEYPCYRPPPNIQNLQITYQSFLI